MTIVPAVEKIKLVGTPAMTKWAKGIRSKRAAVVQKGGVRTMLVGLRPLVSDEQFKAMGIKTPRHMSSFAHGVAIHMLSCPEARWWIDNRDELPYHNLKQSAEMCVAHYIKKKPFK
jgi:hypothetical protein